MANSLEVIRDLMIIVEAFVKSPFLSTVIIVAGGPADLAGDEKSPSLTTLDSQRLKQAEAMRCQVRLSGKFLVKPSTSKRSHR